MELQLLELVVATNSLQPPTVLPISKPRRALVVVWSNVSYPAVDFFFAHQFSDMQGVHRRVARREAPAPGLYALMLRLEVRSTVFDLQAQHQCVQTRADSNVPYQNHFKFSTVFLGIILSVLRQRKVELRNCITGKKHG